MRSDIDRLMTERNLDALILPGAEGYCPYRDYLTRGAQASAIVIKQRGLDPLLIVNHMEIDEAKKSGFAVMTYDEFDWAAINKEHGRGSDAAAAAFWGRVFEHLGLSGRITFYGTNDMQNALRLFEIVRDRLAGQVEIVRDEAPTLFDLAFETKDADELAKLREVGRGASAAMRATREWLSKHRIQDGQIVNGEGQPLTIGMVKRFVRLKLLENDLEDTAMIFAQGRDAGVPHSRGEADEVLRPGESIVFDLFPRQIGGGYHHDMTRTWSLGHAREDVQRDFDLVKDVYFRSLEGINIGEPTNRIDRQVCEWFEAAGHPTRLNTPNTQEGYVHSLGHGLGLMVHESPGMSHLGSDKVVFKAGNLITVEPGLYYPEKGYGIRIEDTIYIDEAGELHNFTDCPYDLVIPLEG